MRVTATMMKTIEMIDIDLIRQPVSCYSIHISFIATVELAITKYHITVAGGVVGGVVLLLLLLFLLFWFKFRPRRQNRRQKRRQRDEEEERQRKKEVEEEQENRHAVNIQGPYQPIPSDEPPHYQRVVAAAAASAPPASPPRGTADFPAELPSPVDGREPSPLPPPSHLDFSKETHWPRQPTQITIHPEERPGRAY